MNIFKCDVCGAEISHGLFSRLYIQRKEGPLGADYREPSHDGYGFGVSLEMDVCDKCFSEKLAEALNIPKDCRYSQSLDEVKETDNASTEM